MTDASDTGTAPADPTRKFPRTAFAPTPRTDVIVALLVATALQLYMGFGKVGQGWDIAVTILCALSACALARSRHWPSHRDLRSSLHVFLRWKWVGATVLAVAAAATLATWLVQKFNGEPGVIEELANAAILQLVVGNAAARVLLLCLWEGKRKPDTRDETPKS